MPSFNTCALGDVSRACPCISPVAWKGAEPQCSQPDGCASVSTLSYHALIVVYLTLPAPARAGLADMALVRLSAATALLRLARMHDARLHSELYLPLALTIQARKDCCWTCHLGGPCPLPVSHGHLSRVAQKCGLSHWCGISRGN